MVRQRIGIVVIVVIVVALQLFADGGGACEKCGLTWSGDPPHINTMQSVCEFAGSGESGRIGCESNFAAAEIALSHNRPCSIGGAEHQGHHCHFSGGECSGTPGCQDANNNGICDDNESNDPDDGSCDTDPAYCGGSPVVVKLGTGPWRFTGADGAVLFDLNADGVREQVTWPARDSAIHFVALDVNGNGAIDNGRELFGNFTSPRNAANGFEALRMYDSTSNGMIEEFDGVWRWLLLWEDVNHDGVSQPAELLRLADSGITALGLDYHLTARHDRNGNAFRQQALLWRDGRVETYYDVWFRFVK